MHEVKRIFPILLSFILTLSSPVFANDFFVAETGAENIKMIETANQYYETIPENVQSVIENSGFSGYITSADLNARHKSTLTPEQVVAVGSSSILGWTSFVNNKIFLSTSFQNIGIIALHECGHAFDDALNFPSLSEAFLSVYNAEKANYNSFSFRSYTTETISPIEYFADAFEEYFINPIGLTTNAPMTYGFIGTLIQKAGN